MKKKNFIKSKLSSFASSSFLKINKNKRYFTLVEILVSISIATVIIGVVIFNYSSSRSKLTLSAASQDIIGSIREVQTSGINVKQDPDLSGDFSRAYGIHFDKNDSSNYYLFIDKNGNGKYDTGSGCGSGSTECVQSVTLKDGVKISDICDSSNCPPVANTTKMDITFLRPNPDAVIHFIDASGNILNPTPSTDGKVVLKSSDSSNFVSVTVGGAGQVVASAITGPSCSNAVIPTTVPLGITNLTFSTYLPYSGLDTSNVTAYSSKTLQHPYGIGFNVYLNDNGTNGDTVAGDNCFGGTYAFNNYGSIYNANRVIIIRYYVNSVYNTINLAVPTFTD